MIRLYATFDGVTSLKPNNPHIVWTDIRDDTGELMKGDLYSNLNKYTLRKGNRYVIDCVGLLGDQIQQANSIKNTYKNPKCGLIRKVSDDYTFIKGKFKGKWISKLTILEADEMKRYLIWLGKNTNNEATVINILNILKIINS